MTAKDFALIAHAIRTFNSDAIPAGVPSATIRADMAEQFADLLDRTNPRFDRSRFIAAATGGN